MSRDRIDARLHDLLAEHERSIVVLAGSNGADKSTFCDVYLGPLRLPFVNADLIAAGLPIADPRELAHASVDQLRVRSASRGRISARAGGETLVHLLLDLGRGPLHVAHRQAGHRQVTVGGLAQRRGGEADPCGGERALVGLRVVGQEAGEAQAEVAVEVVLDPPGSPRWVSSAEYQLSTTQPSPWWMRRQLGGSSSAARTASGVAPAATPPGNVPGSDGGRGVAAAGLDCAGAGRSGGASPRSPPQAAVSAVIDRRATVFGLIG